MDYADDVDVDAEGELEHDTTNGSPGGSGGMTLVSDAASLSALGVPPPSSAATNATAPSALSGGGVGKRYRPAPAKTFQCRGYGECRMVFSRSEHLARHIRKHTGERPFTCHCSKQFSRLDNLRQHAQTVHADKAALNETMMRELTSLHASMTGTVPAAPSSSTTASATSPTAATSAAKSPSDGKDTKETKEKRPTTKRARASGAAVKREPVDESVGGERMGGAMAQRPGTSTGYEGAAAGYMDVDMDMDEPNERQRQRQKTRALPATVADPLEEASPFGGTRFATPPTPPPETPFGGTATPPPLTPFEGTGHFVPTDRFTTPATPADFETVKEERTGTGTGTGSGHNPFSPPLPSSIPASTHTAVEEGRPFEALDPNTSGAPLQHTPHPLQRPPSAETATGSPPTASPPEPFRQVAGPFHQGTAPFQQPTPTQFPPGSSFPGVGGGSAFPASFSSGGSGSRPSTGGGTRLPPLSAVVSSAAFRPSSGHGLPAPGTGGGILLPNSLTLRRPSTGDWEWGDAWNVRPGTAPGKLATAAIVDDSPFSFHPPDQPASFGYGVPAIGSSGNPRKRTFGSPDGPYGAYTDDGDGGGGGKRARRRGGGTARAAYADLMRQHQAAQLRRALDHQQAQADAAMAAYHQQQQAEQAQAAHFYQHQQQQELQQQQMTEEDHYRMQQLHQQQAAQAYLGPYVHPQAHPHSQHGLEMGMDSMALGMEMMEGYPHPAHMEPDVYHSHHQPPLPPQQQHIEQVDSPVLGFPGDSAVYHPHTHTHTPHPLQHPHPHHPPALVETQQHLEAGNSPVSPYSLAYPPTPLPYPHYAETMHSSEFGASTMGAPGAGGFGMRGPEDAQLKYESSQLGMGLDADLGLLDMNMNMNMGLGLGIGLGGLLCNQSLVHHVLPSEVKRKGHPDDARARLGCRGGLS
ncbi:Nutrient and stress factor 1 [Mycena venus]|uniref:Nutrient and stress factor 1 n=1 Tax=Mycena venus TaxID=2733690 RepID=A0A8H6Y9R8_9AGAR|nr:Nutrient and stress factor 1 [Mycena venus]